MGTSCNKNERVVSIVSTHVAAEIYERRNNSETATGGAF